MINFYRNLPVLVTGGAGFIGSHLAENLVALGAQVTVIDNLSTGNLKNLKKIKNKINFLQENIESFEMCLSTTNGASVVFHLAAFVSVPQSVAQPDACFATNATGTLNLLEACARNNVQRFILSSSSAVYGPQHRPCSEDLTCAPESPYGTSKLIAERACLAYAHKINTICLRYFNVYGERQNPEGDYAAVVAKFRHQMKLNKSITIFGDGRQTRDFISVHKVVQANLELAMLPAHQYAGQALNIASGKSITLLELIDQLKKEFPDYQNKLIFKQARAGDIAHSSAHCQKWHVIQKNHSQST